MPLPIAATMPKRSVSLPVATPPRPKPSIARVKASEAAPRVAANSACTTGSTTTTDHIPTLPIEPITSASASRTHAWRESRRESPALCRSFVRRFHRRQLLRPAAQASRAPAGAPAMTPHG